MPYRDIEINEGDLQNEDARMNFAEWIARYDCGLLLSKARQSKDLTQEQLANLARVSQAYISKIENAEANPSIGRLAALLGVMWFRLKLDYVPLVPRSMTFMGDFEKVSSSGSEMPIFKRPEVAVAR